MASTLIATLLATIAISCGKSDDPSAATKRTEMAPAQATVPSKPPMTLPSGPKLQDLIGRSRSVVRKALGKGFASDADSDVVAIKGTTVRVSYLDGAAVNVSVRSRDYSKARDEKLLLDWLGVAYGVSRVVNGRRVVPRDLDDGIEVYDSNVEAKLHKLEDDRCNRGKAQREKWLTTGNDEAHGASPQDEGFRLEGSCSEILYARGFQCDEAAVKSVDGDSPWLAEAAKLGVTTFVCETIANGGPSGNRSTYPIAKILR